MRFKTSDRCTLQRTVPRTYPRVLWTDRDLTFRDERDWPIDDAGEGLDGKFLPEAPLEAATRRIERGLTILDDWDDWTMDMGCDEDDDLARRTLPRSACGSQRGSTVRRPYLGGCRGVPCRAANTFANRRRAYDGEPVE